MGPLDQSLILIAAMAKVRPSHVYHIWKTLELAPTSFDPEAFAKFACLEVKHVAAIVSALSDQNMLPEMPEKVEKTKRGTRLPIGFKIPTEWLQQAREKRYWSQEDVQAEAESFCDYWHAKSGPDALKLDWEATWRSWVRNSRRANGTRSPQSIETNLGDLNSHYERQAALYDKLGRRDEARELRKRIGA